MIMLYVDDLLVVPVRPSTTAFNLSNVSIYVALHGNFNEKMGFTSSPPDLSRQPGCIQCLADLHKVPVSSKRL